MSRRMRLAGVALAVLAAGVVLLAGIRFDSDDAHAEPGPTYQLMVSQHPDGRDARLLQGATVSGTVYVFVAGPDGAPIGGVHPAASSHFRDVRVDGAHASAIAQLAASGITTGCEDGRFCPGRPVTRGQMATFLGRALELPAAPGDRFRDDDRSAHEAMIERVAAAGITHGCSTERFCPSRPVTRGQLAAFLARALGLSSQSAEARFRDVSARHAHAGAIAALTERGIASGYRDGTFRPEAEVTRAQMASLLVRSFER